MTITLSDLTPKEFLTLVLDTPFSSGLLGVFIFTGQASQAAQYWVNQGIVEREFINYINRHFPLKAPSDDIDSDLIVCINCRSSLGVSSEQILLSSCRQCKDSGKVTDSRKAVERLMIAWERSESKNLRPIIQHLIETPISDADKQLLKNFTFGEIEKCP